MTPGARIQAAIEILADIADHHRPAHEALADWGRSHRFAGSADRAAIGNLVFDALRRRASIAWRMGSEEPRALALGVVCFVWGDRPDALLSRFANDRHAPAVPDAAELQALSTASLDGAPDWVRADVPEWIMPSFAATFGDAAVAEAAALGDRPPLDMRVNTLKTTRERLLQTFARHRAVATPLSPAGVRIAPLPGPTRLPNVQAEPAHAKGWFEIQDEGSQLAAFLVDARPGHQVLDFCAGGGGKSLAFAA